MNLAQLDYYFPFVVFVYGAIMTLVLNSSSFLRIAEKHLHPAMSAQFLSHRTLGFVCLIVGAFWSFQNIWLGEPPL